MKAGIEPRRIEPEARVSALRRQFDLDHVGVDFPARAQELPVRGSKLETKSARLRVQGLAVASLSNANEALGAPGSHGLSAMRPRA